MSNTNVRINELIDYIQQGRVMDAMREFYADACVMEEPAYGKTIGLAANLEREQKFVDSVQEFTRFEANPGAAEAMGNGYAHYVLLWATTLRHDESRCPFPTCQYLD